MASIQIPIKGEILKGKAKEVEDLIKANPEASEINVEMDSEGYLNRCHIIIFLLN